MRVVSVGVALFSLEEKDEVLDWMKRAYEERAPWLLVTRV